MLRIVAMVVLAMALATPAPAYEVVTVPDGGTLAGVVRFAGPPPKLDPLPVNKNRDVCGDEKATEPELRVPVFPLQAIKRHDHATVDDRRQQR